MNIEIEGRNSLEVEGTSRRAGRAHVQRKKNDRWAAGREQRKDGHRKTECQVTINSKLILYDANTIAEQL
jgi:hypothetical protein